MDRSAGTRLRVHLPCTLALCGYALLLPNDVAAQDQERIKTLDTVTSRGSYYASYQGPRVRLLSHGFRGGVAPATPTDNTQPLQPLQPGDCDDDGTTPPSDQTGQPVVLASGNKILAERDFATGSGDFVIERWYSKARGGPGFGPGWTWAFDYRLNFTPMPDFVPVCEPGTVGPGEPCPLQGACPIFCV